VKIHTDEKENYKKKVDRMKDEMERMNKDIQKNREKKKRK
jgi:hypothetical protein